MLIRVLRFQGRAPDVIMEAEFTEAGGTIGRSSECTLALPDPERHISRVQAEIAWSAGEFLLIGRVTANSMERNGELVIAGHPVALRDGDELQLGDYVMRVEFQQTQSATQDERSRGFSLTAPAASNIDRTLAAFPQPARAVAGAAEFVETKPAHARASETDFHTSPGLEATQLNTSLRGDAGDAPDAPDAEQRKPAATDAFMPSDADPAPRPHRMPDEAAASTTAFRSWDSPDGSGPTLIVGKSQPRSSLPPAPPVEAPEKLADLVHQVAGAHEREFVAVPKTRPTGFLQELNRKVLDAKVAAGERVANAPPELMQALLSGAGLPDLPGSELDEEMMYRIGVMLRIFSQGLIDLLANRATVKAEMRAEMTIISSDGNNPLKFSPNAATALGYLLGARATRGFMQPDDAVRDAVNDLLAHQAGVMGAVRVALQHLLQRFSPDMLEHRLAGRSMLDSMLPMNRKAKLWELFENVFADVSNEAQDDFDTLFGREFVKAYEEQIKRLEADANQSGR